MIASPARFCFNSKTRAGVRKGKAGLSWKAARLLPGGTLPVNTGGGLLSCYHLADLTGFAEAVRQLRGEAGARQIPNCDVAMSTGHGGELLAPGMCSIHSCTLLGR